MGMHREVRSRGASQAASGASGASDFTALPLTLNAMRGLDLR